MMKRVSLFLVTFLFALCAWAVDFNGIMVINTHTGQGDGQLVKENVLVTVTRNTNGTYKVTLHDFSIIYNGTVYDIGTLEYDNLKGTKKSDGYTYVQGTKQLGVKDIQGYEDMIPAEYRQYLSSLGNKTFPVNFNGYFNTEMLVAHIDTEITLTTYIPDYDMTVTVFHLLMYIDYMGEYVEPQTLKGDVNGDGKVDVEDVNAVINIILELKSAKDYKGVADVTGDGKVDVEDVNAIINIILTH